jgi:spore coat polysaccharide biosynthesis predicted glycosyltransferase SpsG
MESRYFIFADASPEIGVGHVLRTSVIAKKLIAMGGTVYFIGEITRLNWVDKLLEKLGVRRIVNPNSLLDDCHKNDFLIIDTYDYNSPVIKFLGLDWAKRISICDSMTPYFDVDLEISPGLNSSERKPPVARLVSGPEYILTRDGLQKSRRQSLGSRPNIVLVAGGSDPSFFCEAITQQILEINQSFNLHIFSPRLLKFPFKDKRICLHEIGSDFDGVANEAHLAITLASTLALEFIAREIPMGIGYGFENQYSGFREIVQLGFGLPVAKKNELNNWIVDREILEEIIRDEEIWDGIRKKLHGYVDLQGVVRVVNEIIAPS